MIGMTRVYGTTLGGSNLSQHACRRRGTACRPLVPHSPCGTPGRASPASRDCIHPFGRRLRLCDPEVATANSSWESTVGSAAKGKTSVTKSVTVKATRLPFILRECIHFKRTPRVDSQAESRSANPVVLDEDPSPHCDPVPVSYCDSSPYSPAANQEAPEQGSSDGFGEVRDEQCGPVRQD